MSLETMKRIGIFSGIRSLMLWFLIVILLLSIFPNSTSGLAQDVPGTPGTPCTVRTPRTPRQENNPPEAVIDSPENADTFEVA